MEFGVFFFLGLGAIALFGFLSVTTYAEARTEDRREFYRQETFRRLAELDTETARTTLAHIREEERQKAIKEREGLKLGGIITSLVGIGVIALLTSLAPKASMAGVIPLLVGIGLLVYVRYFATPIDSNDPLDPRDGPGVP